MTDATTPKSRLGMVIDLDKCTGCGSCMIACAVENNVPAVPNDRAETLGLTLMRVYEARNGKPYPEVDRVFFPVPCQHCQNNTPCVHVCPQNACDVDPITGVVGQTHQRCMGCRYCQAACPYHTRYFNWWQPTWPDGLEKMLNPDVSPRNRGVVEKCNLCHGRLQAARAAVASEQKKRVAIPESFKTACEEACPAGAIISGDLNDKGSDAAKASKRKEAFRLMEVLKTDPNIYYLSARKWVREMANDASFTLEGEAK